MPPANAKDAELASRIRRGNRDALEAVYAACGEPVHRFAFHMTRSAEAADEILQETFLFLISNADKFQADRGSLLCFLLGVARNFARRRSAVNVIPLGESMMAPDDCAEQFSRGEDVALVREAIAALPPRYREVIVLCDLQEQDYETAGRIIGCPTGTVRSRLHRARTLLAARLQSRCFV